MHQNPEGHLKRPVRLVGANLPARRGHFGSIERGIGQRPECRELRAVQMSTSATEIGRHIGQAADVVGSAVSKVQKDQRGICRAVEFHPEIGDVVDLHPADFGTARPARAECDHRGGPGRRRRPGLLRRGVRGQVARLADPQGDRGDRRRTNLGDPGLHPGRDPRPSAASRNASTRSARTRAAVGDSIEEQSAATLQISNNVADAAAKTRTRSSWRSARSMTRPPQRARPRRRSFRPRTRWKAPSQTCIARSRPSSAALRLSPEHEPEKWKPAFGKDHAQTKKYRL